MQALISGITGTALLVDGDRFSWLRAGESAEPAVASPAYVRQFVSRSMDAFAIENASVELIRTHLDAAWVASGIVSSVLIALNPDETEETRRLACEDLEDSLSDQLSVELAERQLLSSELPQGYESRSMLIGKGQNFCKRLFDLQPTIAATISAFHRINGSYFKQGDIDFRDRFLATAIRDGLMRLIVLGQSGDLKKGQVPFGLDQMQSLKAFSGYQKIVDEWLPVLAAKSCKVSIRTDYLLLTGVTGLLGRYLSRDLLESGQRFALLVRGSSRESATHREETNLQFWERETGKNFLRPVLLEGDLRKQCLGFTSDDKRWVADHCSSIMQSAASLRFHGRVSGEPWLTNFDGTRNVLEFYEATGLRKLHYVSTAYLCGLRPSTMLESELDFGQTFHNYYEESKLRAEMWVRSADFIDELAVYRPVVISGDSKTGYTNTYHGIYRFPASTRNALLYATRQGRDGKGRVVFFAAGNGRASLDNDGYASSPMVIAVAACNDTSRRSVYSDFGKYVWCCFPSNEFSYAPFQQLDPLTPGIWTTDRVGAPGYNVGNAAIRDLKGNYTKSFGGTSSACPVISGVAALVISANPTLTVTDILRRAYIKIDPQNCQYDQVAHSPFYGYGRLDAGAAVKLAKEKLGRLSVFSKLVNIPIPNLRRIEESVEVGEATIVKGAIASVRLTHTYIADLVATLIPPTGSGLANLVLHNRTGGRANNLDRQYGASTTPALASYAGKSGKGTWTFVEEDKESKDSGSLIQIELQLLIPPVHRITSAPTTDTKAAVATKRARPKKSTRQTKKKTKKTKRR